MTGFLLLGVAALWFVGVALIVRFVSRRLPERPWRWLVVMALVTVLVSLPLIDEIVGRFQFERLCEQHSVVQVDLERVHGRSAVLRQVPQPSLRAYTDIPRRYLRGTAIPIREDSWDFIDPESGDVLVSYKAYEAKGGWLIHALGISEGNAPIIFRKYCAPPGRPASVEAFKALGIIYLERTATKAGK